MTTWLDPRRHDFETIGPPSVCWLCGRPEGEHLNPDPLTIIADGKPEPVGAIAIVSRVVAIWGTAAVVVTATLAAVLVALVVGRARG